MFYHFLVQIWHGGWGPLVRNRTRSGFEWRGIGSLRVTPGKVRSKPKLSRGLAEGFGQSRKNPGVQSKPRLSRASAEDQIVQFSPRVSDSSGRRITPNMPASAAHWALSLGVGPAQLSRRTAESNERQLQEHASAENICRCSLQTALRQRGRTRNTIINDSEENQG